MNNWNEYDLLNLWEKANGALHQKWRDVFLNHQAIPKILSYPYESVEHLIIYCYAKKLDSILKDLEEIEADKILDIRKESLIRTPMNNIDVEQANSHIISWDEESYPPFI